MARYIDADALIDFLDVGHLRHTSELCFSEIDVANLLLHAPTISPDEVRGVGKWIKLDAHKGMEQYKCSVCEDSAYVPECMGEPMYNYCPSCGARIVPKDTAIADMLPPLQNGEDKADLIEQMERFQEYAKGGSK